MNSVVIASKLESLRRCLDRITSKKPESLDLLLGNIDLQDILALNLERSIQLCVDIANHILSNLDDSPAMSMAESFERLSEKEIISKELLVSGIYLSMPMIRSIGILFGIILGAILTILSIFLNAWKVLTVIII